jgi:hypothetical protein
MAIALKARCSERTVRRYLVEGVSVTKGNQTHITEAVAALGIKLPEPKRAAKRAPKPR